MSRAGALSSIGSSPARLAVLRSPVASARLGCRVFFLAFMLSSLSCSFFLVFYHLPPVCKKMKRTPKRPRYLEIMPVTLSAAKGLSRAAARSFAALRMTGLDLAGGEELSRAFEPCLTSELRAFCARMEQNASTQGALLMAALDRYSRQTLFGPIGKEGQERLSDASVAIIGCGALGTVLANNLCRAGIGRLVIADRDYIELNNLQRQILFDEDDIARRLPKAIAPAEKLQRVDSETKIETLAEDINADGVESLAKGVDLVLDATDNFETR